MSHNMLPQSPVSIRSAALALQQWIHTEEQHTLHSQPSTPNARRAQVPVHPGRNAPLSWLAANSSPQKLFFRSRQQTFQVAGLGFAHIATGPFFSESIQSSLLAILNPQHPQMRFYGACRFDSSPQSPPHSEWHPYQGFTFILPAVELFCNQNQQFFLAVNYYPPQGSALLHTLLRDIIATPLCLQTIHSSLIIPQARTVHELTSFASWDTTMAHILSQISAGEYDKIVLARRKRFSFTSQTAPQPVHVIAALDEQNNTRSTCSHPSSLRDATSNHNSPPPDKNSTTYLFCLQLDHDKGFVGCTPERLFFLKENKVWTEALAGTVKNTQADREEEALAELRSQKNLAEHRFVVDFVRNTLSDCGVKVKTSDAHVRRLPRLMHLATHIHGEVTNADGAARDSHTLLSSPGSNMFRILRSLHPTPAVCGMPRNRALDEIRKLERFDRGFFAGPLGWFSSESGEFCVAIRSALVHGSDVTAYAGSGIVKASESHSEWNETELKLSAFTELFTSKRNDKSLPTKETNGLQFSSPMFARVHDPSCVCDDLTRNQQIVSATEMIPNQHLSDMRTLASSSVSTEHKSSSLSSNISSQPPSETSGCTVQMFPDLDSRDCGFEESRYFDTSCMEKASNLNAVWGCCAIEELCRNGVRMFFVAPGSRSAPLAVGVRRSQHAKLVVAHDERGAGFLAVGYARASGRAAAIITSSGTAVGNLLPAVIEASADSLPMVLLTADRPPELRDIGANQSISQPRIFGEYASWSADLSCPCNEVPLRKLLSDIDYAVYMSGSCSGTEHCGLRARGPVHLNMMFRECLAPDEQPWNRDCISTVPAMWKDSLFPLTRYLPQSRRNLFAVRSITGATPGSAESFDEGTVLPLLRKKTCGLIIAAGGCGALQTEDDGLAVYELARLLEWPIISDICGGLRLDKASDQMVHYADQIYSSDHVCRMFCPDAVLQIGERITSKRTAKLIQHASQTSHDFVHVLVSSSMKRADPLLTVTHRVSCDINSLLHDLKHMPNMSTQFENTGSGSCESTVKPDEEEASDSRMRMQLLPRISRKVDSLLRQMLETDDNQHLTEPWCARILSECLPRPGALFVGNSMPIRDLDSFGTYVEEGLHIKIAANRGASGIDGIISSGIGYGIGLDLDVVITLGDMSMLHDLNALHLLRTECDFLRRRVTIVVVNNGGGGIFSMLPIAKHRDIFSPVFDTPHHVEFERSCDMFNIEYRAARTPHEFREAMQRPAESHMMIEALVTGDHDSNAALHQKLRAKVAEQVGALLEDA